MAFSLEGRRLPCKQWCYWVLILLNMKYTQNFLVLLQFCSSIQNIYDTRKLLATIFIIFRIDWQYSSKINAAISFVFPWQNGKSWMAFLNNQEKKKKEWKMYVLRLQKSGYNIKQKWKKTFISPIFVLFTLILFLFLWLWLNIFLPSVIASLISFYIFLLWVSTFCFVASGFGLKAVARDLALILLNVSHPT